MAFGRTSVARLVSLKGGWFGFPRFHSSTTSVINLTGGIRIGRNVTLAGDPKFTFFSGIVK